MEFPRIKRLPPYVLAEVVDLKHRARVAGEDIIDLGMGNPDGATPPHIVQKLVEAASKGRKKERGHGPQAHAHCCDYIRPTTLRMPSAVRTG